MSKTFRLPTVINPPDTVCVQIQVPNDSAHIEAFWGALETLCKAWAWDYTDDHKGSQIAYVWQEKIDNAVQAVRDGTNCIMPIDCNEVENCLSTSPIIAAIMQDITDNQNAITTNANNISDHENRLSQAELSIQQHNLDISDLQSRMGVVETNLSQNNVTISDHENRITTLESSGGGGSGQNVRATAYTIPHLSLQQIPASGGWTFGAGLSHDFIYKNALIIVEIKMHSSSGSTYARMRVKCGTQIGNHEGWARGTAYVSTQLNQAFENIPIGTQSIDLEFNNESGIESTIIEHEQQIQLAIIEFSDVSLSQSDIVTFEANSYPYTLLTNQVGTVQNTGNPDNALDGLPDINEFIGIEVDNGGQDITDIVLDMYLENKNPFRLQIIIDSVLEYDQPLDFVGQNMVWFNHRVSDYSSIFPLTNKNTVEVKLLNTTGGITNARIDNIDIQNP